MRLLHQVPGSVLWLRSMGPATASNLKDAAAARGIAGERLIFAKFEPRIEAHLARLQLADLFLDTLPYNAHTTAAEALWAGVPVVTCSGRSFAGRVGASLLSSCGLTDLICTDLGAYEALALKIAHSAQLRTELRERLRHAGRSAPAFDTRRYTRDLEDLLVGAHSIRAMRIAAGSALEN
jgi:predicted O-linked N-acetylglucosamine transferase (SPINDLY family)